MTPPPPRHATEETTAAAPATTPARRVLHNLMRSLHLENFMLHEESQVDFSAPITLITGANGSGKTQILDALLLCLGARSQRIRRQGISELVGPAAETARVTLALNNPPVQADGRLFTEADGVDEGKVASLRFRPLTTGQRETDRLTDHDIVHVIIEMSRESDTLKYRLGPPGKERNVTAGSVERLFSQAGVSPRNSLAFTEEGTIGNFTSDSPQKQFEQFLETTALLDLRRTLVNVHGEVGNCQGRLDPVQQQYSMHRAMLEHMRADLENLDKRDELEARARNLRTELEWAKAASVAKAADELTQMRDAQREREKIQTEARDKATKQLDDVRKQMETLGSTLESLQVQARDRALRLGDQKARLENANDSASKIERDIAKLDTKIAALIDEVDPEALRQVAAENDAALAAKEALQKDLRELDKAIIACRTATTRSLRDGLPGSVLKARGLDTLIKCLRLRKVGEEAGLISKAGGSVFGPLVVEWNLRSRLAKEVKEQAARAVPALLGDLLADFVAADRPALQKLMKRLTKTFPKPPAVRMHVAPDAAAPPSGKLPAGVLPLEDLLAGPDAVLALVAAARPAAMATDAAKLDLAAAQKLSADTGRAVWLPDGCVVTANSVQWTDAAAAEVADRLDGGLDSLNAAADALAQEQELLPQKDALAEKLTAATIAHESLHMRLGQLETQLRAADGLREERGQLHAALQSSEKTRAKIGKEIESLEARDREDTKQAETQEKLEKARNRRSELESREAACQRDIENASRRASDYEVQLVAKLQEVQEAKLAASALGSQPPGARPAHEIEQELNQTVGTLEGLRRVTRTREEYELQRQHVEQLQKDVEQARGHLEGLQTDLESRLAEWDRELTERLTGAQRVLRHLLRDHFDDVRLGVRDAIRRGKKNPADDLTGGGALDFRVQRRNGRLLNLGGLCGGEKVLVVEGLIFALHCLTDSPVHALDEFTQKLDVEFKSAAFRMALDAVAWAREHSHGFFAPQFVLLCPDTLGIEIDSQDVSHVVVVRAETPLQDAAGSRVLTPGR